MASSAITERSKGELISHFTGVRMRVTGSGSLRMSLYSFQQVNTQVLLPFQISNSTNREPFRLANFNEQRASLEIKTTNFQEQFKINRILIFTKAIYTEHPGIS